MDLRITPDYEAMSAATAQLVADQIAAKPDSAVVLPTGNTPIGAYRDLTARYERGELDTSRLRLFQLDEYLGIGPDDPRSLYGWNVRAIVEPLGIPLANVVRLPGDTGDPQAACRTYDRKVEEAGGFDLALLGLGPNGHLGYNEPPTAQDAPTRVVELTESSLETGAQYWGSRDQVPRRALTAGMRQLLSARHIVLIVSGAHKRDILRRALEGPVTPDVPASWLQQAPNVTVIADDAAWPS